jgi:gliding motility-associated-like protein
MHIQLPNLLTVVLMATTLGAPAQTVIFSHPGASYNNTDAVTTDNYGPADVSNCSSISFSIEYNFSQPFSGPFNMESSDECPFGIPPCQGDPTNPTGGGCDQCWDFFYVQFQIDGVTVNTQLVGVPGSTNQSGTLTYGPVCTAGAGTAGFIVQTQSWAADETITFSNVQITCWDASAADLTSSPANICEDDPFSLTATLTDPGSVATTSWTGPGSITTPGNLFTWVENAPPNTNTYTFTATDDNACTSSSTIDVEITRTPIMDVPPDITVCENDQVDIAFTGSGNYDYTWVNSNTQIGLGSSGNGDISFVAESNPIPHTVGNITVTPSDNGCLGISQTFTISTRPMPVVEQHPDSTYCSGDWIFVCPVGTPAHQNGIFWAGATFTSDNPEVWQVDSAWVALGVCFGVPSAEVQQQEIINFTMTPQYSDGLCPLDPLFFTVIVNPIVEISDFPSLDVCAGEQVSVPLGFPDFTWTNTNPAIGLPNSGVGDISFTAANVTSVTTGIIDIMPQGGCFSGPNNFSITVYPKPIVNPITDVEVCPGTMISKSFTGTAGATYSWTNSNPAIGLPSSGNGPINFTSAPVSQQETATITVISTIGGCIGDPVTFMITVNPIPVVDDPGDRVVCINDYVEIALSGTIGGDYNWTNSNTAIGLDASGTGNISFFAANVTAPTTGIITISPPAGVCPGLPESFSITVSPPPTMNQPNTITACAGAPVLAPFSGSAGTVYHWINADTIIGLGPQGVGNIQFNAAWLTVQDTATITVTPMIGACIGPPKTFQIIIQPAPVLLTPADQTVCAGTNVAVTFSGPDSTSFAWLNNNTAIGLDSSGVGNIGFVADSAGTGTITVTPTAYGCPGQSQSFDIQVLPLPDLLQPADLHVCAGDSVWMSFSGTSGANISWVNTNAAIGLGANGSGSLAFLAPPVNTLTTGQITATPSTGLCTGQEKTFNISIHPLPAMVVGNVGCAPDMLSFHVDFSSTGHQFFASAGTINGNNGQFTLDAVPAGTNITITAIDTLTGCQSQLSVNAPNCNCAPVSAPVSPSHSVICESDANPALAVSTAPGNTVDWYSQPTGGVLLLAGSSNYTPPDPFAPGVYAFYAEARELATNCSSPIRVEVTITVNPRPLVAPVTDQSVCAGETISVNFSGTASATMSWLNNNTAIGLGANDVGNISFVGVNTGNAPITGLLAVTPSLNGCVGDPQIFSLTVNPIPTLVIDSTVCATDLDSYAIYAVSGANSLQSSVGMVTGAGPQFVIGSIPAGTPALLTATNSLTGCTQQIPVSAPPCACPPVDPPTGPGVASICAGAPIPGLTVNAVPGILIDWYNSASGGVLLQSGSNTYTPAGPLAPGTYTFYAESRSSLSDCTSAARTPVVLTIQPLPAMTQPQDQTVCAGTSVEVLFSGSAGNVYAWTNNNPGIGLQAAGNGNILFPAMATGASQTAQIAVTPQLGMCSGPAMVFQLTVFPIPVVTITGNTTVCAGNVVTLTASGGTNVVWNTGQTGTSIQVQPVSSGSFTATVTENGCSGTDNIDVTVLQPSAATVYLVSCDPAQAGTTTAILQNAAGCDSVVTTITTFDVPGCAPSAALTATPVQCFGQNNGVLNLIAGGGLAPYQYAWSNGTQSGSGVIGNAGIQVQVPNLVAGTYTVTITSANGLAHTITAQIQTPPLLTAQAVAQQIFGQQMLSCEGATDGQILAGATGGQMPYQYNWSNGGGNTALLTGIGAGVYTVTITDLNQCTATGSASLTDPPPPAFQLTITDTICMPRQVRTLLTPLSGAAPYSVRIDGLPAGGGLTPALTEGNHLIEVSDAYGCKTDTTIQVTLPPAPNIGLPADLTVNFGETLVLEAETNLADWTDLNWSPPGAIDCPDCLLQEWLPETSGLYEVMITDRIGCTANASLFVTVKLEPAIYVPNVFSPDDDGNNDTWNIFTGDSELQLKTLFIFDRWGEQLYTLEAPVPLLSWPGWDGIFRGQAVLPGVYVYYFEVLLPNGALVVKKGDVTLIR